MSRSRGALAALGCAVVGYGGWLLVSRQEGERVLDALVWLVGGVLVHDALLAPLTLACGFVATRWLNPSARVPAIVALVVLGPLTLLAVPVLTGFGADPGNLGLQDRPYRVAWAALVAVGLAAVAGAALLRRARDGER